jgi:YHS domain-containing protein
MRSIGFLVWLLAVAAVLWPLLRRTATTRRGARVVRDQLVKDPVCATYIVRSRALVRGSAAAPLYFCSDQCASRYAGTARG